VESEYLRTLNEAVSLDDWKAIVQTAVGQAKDGDGKARDWLTRYVLGAEPPRLTELVAQDIAGAGVAEDLLKALVRYVGNQHSRAQFHGAELREAVKLLGRAAEPDKT
jgi:hypothetical protein